MNSHAMDNSLHFLVVDDDSESRSTVVEYLRSMGFNHVTMAHDGTDAIRLLERDTTINFIISDWDMPLMNGLTLLQRIKMNPNRSHIPFLVMTSPVSAEAEKVILAAENLVDAYLIKPFRSQALMDKIQRVLTVAAMGHQKQVVIVDDDPDARDMMIEYIRQMGFKDISPFEDGASALKYIMANPEKVGLIISDWEMPKMTGIELLRTCKAEKATSEVPFLIVTSQTSIERMKIMQAARASVDHYLVKPFVGEDFRSRINDVLDKARSSVEVRQLTLEGLENLENGKHPIAAQKFEEALKLQPDSELALRGMADVVAKQKGWQAALPYYKKAIDINPVNSVTYLKLATAYEKLGWVDKAVALLESANKQIGFNADLHFCLGKLYAKQNMLNEAQAELEKTLEIQLDHQEAKLMLEIIELQKKGAQK